MEKKKKQDSYLTSEWDYRLEQQKYNFPIDLNNIDNI